MRSPWVPVLGLLILVSHYASAEVYHHRAVLPRASIETSVNPSVSAASSSNPTDDANTASNSQQVSSDALTVSSLPSSNSSSAIPATSTQASSSPSTNPTLRSASSPTSSDFPALSTANSTAVAANGTRSITPKPTELPIKPTITPALSVAGAFLILSGVFYTLIGIKTKWLHIFMSTAYLVSLAVTVLVVYVMHPPVSAAIQGAYFVAAFATGILLGGGAVIFADLTEGFSCLLGGFSLSMWFLELRPDGLIRSTIGKSIFIACFSLGACFLYGIRYTRPYGLIGSISFAGATVIVLGIDCFSRAGLKEFWVYIWNLNNGVLPPHYEGPYPITRGMRVEIAATVLLSLMGLISQLKVWKLVKKHRAQRAAARLDEEKRQDEAESKIGREIEQGIQQQRLAWEAIYGDQPHGKAFPVDSGVDTGTTVTPRKASVSPNEIEDDQSSIAKGTGTSVTKAQQPPQVTIRVASEDSVYELPSVKAEETPMSHTNTHIQPTAVVQEDAAEFRGRSVPSNLATEPIHDEVDGQVENRTGPSVIPLPFRVTDEDLEEADDRSSIATVAVSDRRMSKGLSVSSLVRNLSNQSKRQLRTPRTAEERYMIPHDEDPATSVAATFDIGDRLSLNGQEFVSKPQTPSSDNSDSDPAAVPLISTDSVPLTVDDLSNIDSRSSAPHLENSNSSGHIVDAAPATNDGEQLNSGMPTLEPSHCLAKEQHNTGEDHSSDSTAPSQTDQSPAVPASLRHQLPEGGSKVVTAYRTNEWAKHLEQAEAPPPEALGKALSGIADVTITTSESAAPVRVRELQQTPLTAEPAPIKIRTDPELRRSQQPHPLNRSVSSSRDALPSQRRNQPPSPQKSSLRRSSQGKLINRTSSQTTMHHQRVSRRSSAPLTGSPLAESPIEEGVETFFPQRSSRNPAGMPSNTLIAQRNSQLQTRYSSTSLARTNSSDSLNPGSNYNDPRATENPALVHRLSLLQRPTYRSSGPRLTPRTSASYSPSHVSPNSPSTPIENRESIVSAWRTSLRNDSSADLLNEQQMDAKRDELLIQKRMASASAQAVRAERVKRESQRDGEVRRGDLMERHKEAMRRMQAGVEL